MREDVYRVVKAFAEKDEPLGTEAQRYVDRLVSLVIKTRVLGPLERWTAQKIRIHLCCRDMKCWWYHYAWYSPSVLLLSENNVLIIRSDEVTCSNLDSELHNYYLQAFWFGLPRSLLMSFMPCSSTGSQISSRSLQVRDFERLGLNLNKETRSELEFLNTQIGELCIVFQQNVNEENQLLYFNENELAGVPTDFLKVIHQLNDNTSLLNSLSYKSLTSRSSSLKVEKSFGVFVRWLHLICPNMITGPEAIKGWQAGSEFEVSSLLSHHGEVQGQLICRIW